MASKSAHTSSTLARPAAGDADGLFLKALVSTSSSVSNPSTVESREASALASAVVTAERNGELRKVRFFVSDVESGARASKFACFPPKTGSRRSPCSEFRFLPRKACEFLLFGCKSAQNRAQFPSSFSAGLQPAEVVRQPAELVTTEVTAPSGKAANSSPLSMSPLVTALSPLSLGPKSAQKKGLRNQLRGFDGFANPG